MKIAVIGAGAWGTALAQIAAKGGRETLLWALESEVVDLPEPLFPTTTTPPAGVPIAPAWSMYRSRSRSHQSRR